MIPSALTAQLQRGLADFLRFSFWSSTPGMEHVIDNFIKEGDGLLKGPYISLKLPFKSGKDTGFFPNVPLGFTPHLHQEQAFKRLGGRRKESTLIATGTGSGKTECFLLPILEHCLQTANQPGVKAILIYPMNALATDQAARIAKMIHGSEKLRGTVSAGLYIGEDGGKKAKTETKMGPATVITDRSIMQESPPDIILTNYKMLDYLLLRPRDQAIWQHNAIGTLRFLVVDEIHTFDGAQGTDLACLIRRLKRRLQVDDGSLCCVGTSATLGGDAEGKVLMDYASQVFGEPLLGKAVIGESRLSENDYLKETSVEFTNEPTFAERDVMDPTHWTDPAAWVRAQATLWFGQVHKGDGASWAVELGERLKQHAAFRSLLIALEGKTVDLSVVVARMSRQRSEWRKEPELGSLAVMSLVGLVSAARIWREELPTVRQEREAAGRQRAVQPMVDVRVQLWQRELRRMVGSLEKRPRLRHSMDLDRNARRRHLPLIHCRDCGAMGWATLIQRDKPNRVRVDLDRFYRAFFAKDAQIEFLFPAAAIPAGDPAWPRPAVFIDIETMSKVRDKDDLNGSSVEVVPSENVRSTSRGPELTRDCPFCMAHESLALIGFRAATLTSVYIDQLYASPFNDDKKLLAFSDSVQDAAHRAGFFGARTWRTNLRVAMLRVISANDGLSLAQLAATLGPALREKFDMDTWVSTFLAPNMTWLHDWGHLKKDGKLPKDSELVSLIDERLAFEVFTEFGMQSGIGRSLIRTGTAAINLDTTHIDTAVDMSLETLQNEVPGMANATAEQLRGFLNGLLTHLRSRGGVLDGGLPERYIETGGKDLWIFKQHPAYPAFGQGSRMPVMLTDTAQNTRFDTWGSGDSSNWYSRWVRRCFGQGEVLTADAASMLPVLMPLLVSSGLVKELIGKYNERIWGIAQDALMVTSQVGAAKCIKCGHVIHVPALTLDRWTNTPCLTARCQGTYEPKTKSPGDYFARLYAGGDLERIFTEEHTGLLTRAERERVETEFKALEEPVGDDVPRKPWFANLLSCTPTLEMGIDIGDLSSTFLCSVPPTQSNYLQRIGRAGREDGNSFALTVAGGRPHDLYFFNSPGEMFAGEVTPPGVFLDAPAVLERQLTAFCFDRWVAHTGTTAEIPAQLRSLFGHLNDKETERFPFNLLAFVEQHQPTLLREFEEMFANTISDDTREHLKQHMVGTKDGKAGIRWKILNLLEREKKQRDSLSQKARTIREEIKRRENIEAKSQDHAEQLELLDREKSALVALVGQINQRYTLEFLTEEGLLPNYAFPEAAVSLKSVIWRKKKTPASGGNYETWSHEYKRSPASALSELAPEADFYAGGRKVQIDQVDVAISKVEEWRFCPECSYANRIDTGDESETCPACNCSDWPDDGQKFRMMRLTQVFANTPDRGSRIRDDKDDRQPRFFQRSVAVNINDEDRAGAWHIEDDNLPFGFELLKRATFREINFGAATDQGALSLVAGHEAVRPGFQICAKCGKVQKKNREPEHALSCPCRKPNAKVVLEDCLYLYREFQSEAIRLLLPMTDVGTQKQLHSFVAALQLGLKTCFQGSVDHLRTTVYSDPIEGSALRKQYLVLYDTVPGGTGYLKQLVTPAAYGDRMPIFEVMERALQRIEGCSCWDDPERDGCYGCLYAYRNARDMDDTSATTAAELLRQLLKSESKLKDIESLGQVSVTGLMDSILEARFIEALRQIKGIDGKLAKLEYKVVNKKTGYHWTLNGTTWEVELQVEPPASLTLGVPVSIDFVMRPAKSGEGRNIAIFLDGWTYHKNRVGTDLRQRQAMIASGNWDVWNLTWHDLDEKFDISMVESPPELAIPVPAKLHSGLKNPKVRLSEYADIGEQSTFNWLERELIHDIGLPWSKIAEVAVTMTMAPAINEDEVAWRELVQKNSPPDIREHLLELKPRLCYRDIGETNPHIHWMVVHDGTEFTLLCCLNDASELYETPEYKSAWRGVLRMFQLLRHLPNTRFVTTSMAIEDTWPAEINTGGDATEFSNRWNDFDEIDSKCVKLAQKLIEAGVPAPEVGLDIPDSRGETWTEGELVWEEFQVAVVLKDLLKEARGNVAADWRVWTLEDLDDDASELLATFDKQEEQ